MHSHTSFAAVGLLLLAASCTPGRTGVSQPPGDAATIDSGRGDAATEQPDLNGVPSFTSKCSGASTTLTGTVTAPNGTDPVANALVYVPTQQGTFPPGVQCELCDAPVDSFTAQTTSNPDGTFSLDIGALPATAMVSFTVNKGRFRRNTMVPVTACKANALVAPHTVLPGKTATGDDIPKIAVATGNKDQLDAVLAAMGLDTTVGFDCYEGRKSATVALTSPCGMHSGLAAIETMLTDATKLDSYNLVFLSCAPGKFASLPAATQATITTNLQTWTGKGGRLFVTDNSYDYVAQAFPTDISFLNGNTTVDDANVGVGGSSTMPTQYDGKINDATLASWLATVGAVATGATTLTLSGYLNDWSVIGSVPMTTTDYVDATNAVAYTTVGGTTAGTAMSYPQTVQFDVAPMGSTSVCGRTIYTSYHTLPTTMTVSAQNLAPQERILEYLMLQASDCVSTIN